MMRIRNFAQILIRIILFRIKNFKINLHLIRIILFRIAIFKINLHLIRIILIRIKNANFSHFWC